MATDRLINQTQGEDIIDQLTDIATKVGAITYGPQTTSDKVVAMTGYAKASTEADISQGDTLNEAVGKLEKKADDALAGLDDKVVGPESSTTGAIATYSNATGNVLANSGVTIATSTQGVTDSDTAVPTSKAVQAYAASTEHTYAFDTGTDNGTIKVTPSVGGVAGTAQPVAVKGLAGAAYKGVDTTPTASSSNLVESGGVYTALGNKLDVTANAASAAKLNNGSSDYSVGSATKGVYFSNGVPTEMTYSVGTNVPQDAVFTDTTYTKATNSAISVDNTNHTIDVATASTTTKGVVQLTNTLPASTATEDNKVPTALTVSQAIAALPEPMVFKGSVTGTYPSNPSVGDTYKATANSNSGVTPAYKSGDTVIYATDGWTVIPSGDEPSGTVTAVSVNGTQYDPGTGGVVSLPNYPDISGKIDTAGTGLSKDGTTLNHSNSITAVTTAGAYKVKYDAQGHITGTSALAASDISAVPTSRTINSKALSSNITLSASDVSAVPTTRTVNSKALSSNITLAGSDIALTGYSKASSASAVAATDTVNQAIGKLEKDLDGYVPTTRTINSKALSSNITLSASDVSAVPTTRTVNSKALSSNITLAGSDIALTGYSKGSSTAAVVATDTTNSAIAKHENRINTNQTNILYGINKVGKNDFKYEYVGTSANNYSKSFIGDKATFTIQPDNTALKITTNGALSLNEYIYFINSDGEVNNFKEYFDGNHYLTGIPSGASTSTHRIFYTEDSKASVSLSSDTLLPDLSSATRVVIGIQVQAGQNYGSTGILYKPMFILKSIYETDPSYQPYALPNYDLTYLQAEDRASLAEVVDSGAKNLLYIPNGTYTTSNASGNPTTFTVSDGVITVTACTTNDTRTIDVGTVTLKAGNYVLDNRSFENTSGDIRLTNNGTSVTTGNPSYFTLTATTTLTIKLYTYNTAALNKTIKPLLCTKAAFGVSQKFVPYCKSNSDLTGDMSLVRPMNPYGQSTVSSGSLDNINQTETRVYNSNVVGVPTGLVSGTVVICESIIVDGNTGKQTLHCLRDQTNTIYHQTYPTFIRTKTSGTWKPWACTTTNESYFLIRSNSNISSATVDISTVPDGTYLLRCANSESATTRYGVSLYTLLLNSTGTTMLFNPIVEVANSKISNLIRTDNTLNFTFDHSGYHTVTLTAI